MVSDTAKAAHKLNTAKFISSLEMKEHMWNHKLPGHYHKAASARESLAKEFNTNEAVVKYKYNALRTYFVKEHKKIQDSARSGAGSTDIYESSWEWYQQLLFLKDTVAVAPTLSSLENVDRAQEMEFAESMSIPENMPDSIPDSIPDSSEVISATATSTPRNVKKRKTQQPTTSSSAELVMLEAKTTLEKLATRTPPDHYEHFGALIAGEIRSVNTDRGRCQLMSQIMETVSNFKGNQSQQEQEQQPYAPSYTYL